MTSWKLFSVQGIEVRLHWSLLLLLLFILLFGFLTTGTLDLFSLIWMIVLFGSVAFHELSHSLVARSMGIGIERIVLLPIGGMAMMKQNVFAPNKEFKMSVAGPLFNFAVCALIIIFQVTTDWQWFLGWTDLATLELVLTPPALFAFIISAAFWLNLALGVFNFMPAIPMDGGRVFRSLLAMKMDYLKATRIATIISNVLMVGLFLVGIYINNWILAIIAIFILLASRAELEVTVSNRLLDDFPLSKLIRQNYLIVKENDTLQQVIEDMITSRSLVAFSKKDHKIEEVSLYDIQSVPKTQWKKIKFSEISEEQHPVTEQHPASFALNKMNELNSQALPVIDENHEIIGCVFRNDIATVLEILKVSKL